MINIPRGTTRVVAQTALLFLLTPLIASPVDKQAYFQAKQANRRPLTPGITSVSNKFIALDMADNGQFTIGTVAGDPSRSTDNNQKLLYGHPFPATSDTMIDIDGSTSSIHSGTPSGVGSDATSASITLMVGPIAVFEQLSIVVSPLTGNADTIQIYFRTVNTDSVSHVVALRTQLDTQLGENDGAPFRVAGVGAVTNDREFLTTSVPPDVLVLDNLITPNIVANFAFRNVGFTDPDRVVLGFWPASVDEWDYIVDPTRTFLNRDSSVIVYWGYPSGAGAFTLAPGGVHEMAIDYGVGNCSTVGGSPFNLLLCSPSIMNGSIQGASFQYTPVPITAFLTNITAKAVAGGIATLNLPSDLNLGTGFLAKQLIENPAASGSVDPGQSTQVDWQVVSSGRVLGIRDFSVSVTAGGAHYTTLRSFMVATIPNAVYGMIADETGAPIVAATVTLMRGSTDLASTMTQSDGTYAFTGLAPGDYSIRVSRGGQPDTYSNAVVSGSTTGGQTASPGAFAAAGNLNSYAYPNPVREGNVHITYFTGSPQTIDVKIFTTDGRLITKISDGSTGTGWHTVDWPIEGVANGVYFYLVESGSNRSHGKIAVLKRHGL